jgi:hypothetical protein
MLRRLILMAACASALSAAGCITPSIPIPPPDPEMMTFTVTLPTDGAVGAATFSYPPNENYGGSVVYVYDRSRDEGVIGHANDDGSVAPTQSFPAALGDAVDVTFQREDQTVSICILLQQGQQSSTAYCP